jgi:hypothetical protein
MWWRGACSTHGREDKCIFMLRKPEGKRLLRRSRAGLSNEAPVIYFPGALFYSAGFNFNQNFKGKYF